jgi:photosystem II stability/assembly factor-like uncharacterized protein
MKIRPHIHQEDKMTDTEKTNNAIYNFLFLAICLFSYNTASAGSIELFHVHGLSYSADGKTLYVPAHFGLVLYENGQWRNAPGPKHDYMGFAATRNAFYTSGHPAADSGMINPFGLMKSADSGRTWKRLGMTGEADFHVLATSYGTNTVYVFNMGANSRLPSAGLYYTSDDGSKWNHAKGQGAPQPFALAAHPAQSQRVAIGAKEGLFLSGDHGQTFKQVGTKAEVYGVWFDLNGDDLWYAGVKFSPFLVRRNLETQQEQFMKLPPMGRDAVDYITQNPAHKDEYAISTFQRNVFLTRDAGKTWRQIARQGATL